MRLCKKIGKALLFPHKVCFVLLIPVSAILLVYSFGFGEAEEGIRYLAYVLSFYTLFALCVRIPDIVRLIRAFREENRYAQKFRSDARFRISLSLYGSFFWNAAYAVFQFGLGVYHASGWFYAMAAYYLALAVMRFFLLWHIRTYQPGEQMRKEFLRYVTCGWILLFMNLALSGMIFFMVFQGRTFHHHEITTIAMATYTFSAFTIAIVNLIRYRKYRSPIFSASKAINLAAASVSMLTLEATMLTTFGEGNDGQFRPFMMGITGAAVSLFVIVMALIMIVKGRKELKKTERTGSGHRVR